MRFLFFFSFLSVAGEQALNVFPEAFEEEVNGKAEAMWQDHGDLVYPPEQAWDGKVEGSRCKHL